MAQGAFVSYYRVSTVRQGQSGLGLEAQREAVRRYLNGGNWKLVGEFTEVESGRKSDRDRPQLAAALDLCRREKATLVIAKLDRLSRDVQFLFALRNGNVEVRAVDMPTATTLEFGIRAVFAQHEREEISRRTKAALAQAKARGVRLGVAGPRNLKRNLEQRTAAADAFAERLRPVLLGLMARGLSQRAILAELNKLGIAAPRGGAWHLPTLQRVLARVRPERTVRVLAGELWRSGLNVPAIVAELAKRGAFAPSGKPYTLAAVQRLVKAA